MAIATYYMVALFINKITIESNAEKYSMFIIHCSFIIWLGGRAAIVSLMITFIFVMIMSFIINEFSIKKVINTLSLMFLSCLVSIPFSIFPWNGMNRLFFNMETNQTMEQFANGRFELWVDTWGFIIKQPMFGYGADAYRFTVESGHYQPHNFVLQILLEFGIIGAMTLGGFFLILLLKSIYLICKYKQTDLLISVSIIMALFGHAMLDGTLYHAQPVMLLSILCSYLAYNHIDKTKCFYVKESARNNPN
ncbi:O-antigen ligase family protein [Vibrio rarus]|uniref:O-antigen ligase family protein n=1 Tax=Vibrio rarus TaxID=413403 RepID=UPI0021C29142|nr:O-antigen ligase family protein [Vibrio rarus]